VERFTILNDKDAWLQSWYFIFLSCI